MRQTDQSLLEQMRITDFAISNRKELFSFSSADEATLKKARPHIEPHFRELVDRFYEMQTAVPDIALLIGDSDTLDRLKSAQHRYLIDLFSGHYDVEYVNHRLRIGLVHKRIGVDPKLYLAAVQTLTQLLLDLIRREIPDAAEVSQLIVALQKLLMFDVSLVFDTYIRSMVAEIEISKARSDSYARALEEKVKERTVQLEELSRTDALTGLLNVRILDETLTRALRAAQRRNEPVAVAYMDINDFKIINDTLGHQHGDKTLQIVADALKSTSRLEDRCFRYGGDEFLVLMPNTTQAGGNVWKDRLLENLKKHENAPSLSIGITHTGPDEYLSPAELIRQADDRMYADKRSRKGA